MAVRAGEEAHVPDAARAEAVEALYARYEAQRRSGVPEARLWSMEAQRAILETLEALGVYHIELQEFDGDGGFTGFRLKVPARGA